MLVTGDSYIGFMRPSLLAAAIFVQEALTEPLHKITASRSSSHFILLARINKIFRPLAWWEVTLSAKTRWLGNQLLMKSWLANWS